MTLLCATEKSVVAETFVQTSPAKLVATRKRHSTPNKTTHQRNRSDILLPTKATLLTMTTRTLFLSFVNSSKILGDRCRAIQFAPVAFATS